MNHYRILLTYLVAEGDEVQLDFNNVKAKDQEDALKQIPQLLGRLDELKDNPIVEAIKASGDNPTPTKIDIIPIPPPPPVREGRFILQPSRNIPDGWVATDKDNGVVVTFKTHRFNETKKITFLSDAPIDHLVRARLMREIGDWLCDNHKDKVF